MYRDKIFLKLNKHTGFNKHTGVVHFAQNRKKYNVGKNQKFSGKFRKIQKILENFGKIQIILEKGLKFSVNKWQIMQGKLLYRLK